MPSVATPSSSSPATAPTGAPAPRSAPLDPALYGKDFRALSLSERRARVAKTLGVTCEVAEAMLERGIDGELADSMVENAIGVLGLPFGLGLNFVINDKSYVVPMAIEEPSVIAAASSAAKRILAGGGFVASADASLMAAQVELTSVADVALARKNIEAEAPALLVRANDHLSGLPELGGGSRELVFRDLGEGRVVIHLVVDCRDAMGANMLNTMAEALGPRLAELARGTLGLRILSNLCDRRRARSEARVPFEALGDGAAQGRDVALAVERASRFADADVYRAVTHNKGIMNGVDAVVLATGNDWRAVEAGAHCYAARDGRYAPLSTWRVDEADKVLKGQVEMPMALGIVGGALRAHRGARAAVDLLGVTTSAELAMICVSVGLASNLAALRALATEGIQRGHMALHKRTTAPAQPKGDGTPSR